MSMILETLDLVKIQKNQNNIINILPTNDFLDEKYK